MFVQVPRRLGPLLKKWVALLKKQAPMLEARCYVTSSKDTKVGPKTSFFLRKGTGAPETLPTLDHKTVRTIGILRADSREDYLNIHRRRKYQ